MGILLRFFFVTGHKYAKKLYIGLQTVCHIKFDSNRSRNRAISTGLQCKFRVWTNITILQGLWVTVSDLTDYRYLQTKQIIEQNSGSVC